MFFNPTDSLETTFWVFAFGGTLFFVLRILFMLFVGGDHDMDADGHIGGDIGHDGTDVSFNLFSLQSLTGFFMMFGWVGLSLYVQSEVGPFFSVLGAFAAGLSTMFITAAIFRAAMNLVNPGSRFVVDDAVGKTASVYQRIPADGRGRIQLTLAGSTREIDAISEEKADIDSFTSVEVVRKVDDRTVAVKTIG